MADQPVGGGPGLLLRFANDQMDTKAEAYRPALRRRGRSDAIDLFGKLVHRFAPAQIGVNMFGSDRDAGVGRASEPKRRMGLLDRWEGNVDAVGGKVLALEIRRLARKDSPPDRQEFVGLRIVLVVAELVAVAGEICRIRARDDVEQDSTTGNAIQGGRMTRKQGRSSPAGPQCDEELQAFDERDQPGRHDPGVFAPRSCGQEHTLAAKPVGGLGNLLEISEGCRPVPQCRDGGHRHGSAGTSRGRADGYCRTSDCSFSYCEMRRASFRACPSRG